MPTNFYGFSKQRRIIVEHAEVYIYVRKMVKKKEEGRKRERERGVRRIEGRGAKSRQRLKLR